MPVCADRHQKELAKLAGASSSLGADDKGLARAAKHFGFKVKVKNNSSFKDIKKWLDKKVPVIVNWFTRGRKDYSDSDIADGHYSVIAGIDDKFIYLQDPEIGKIRKLERDDFMRVWFDFRGEYIKSGELIIKQIIVIYR
jgi:ABC-type bacteriocin/lantibiotic exporter with double-glycine peptidase domain